MIEKLRQATKHHHTALDHAVYPLIQSVDSTAKYGQLLSIFLGYFQPIYAKLDVFINRSILPDYETRRKPAAIIRDMQTIGIRPSAIKLCDTIPSITDPAAAFGAMYVLEGSTMGGKIIGKKLKENTGLDDNCFQFFTAYGELNPRRWGVFVECLQHPELITFPGSVIQTAIATFTQFHQWINFHYPSRKISHQEAL